MYELCFAAYWVTLRYHSGAKSIYGVKRNKIVFRKFTENIHYKKTLVWIAKCLKLPPYPKLQSPPHSESNHSESNEY